MGAVGEVPMADQLNSTSLGISSVSCSKQRILATGTVNVTLQGSTTTLRVELYRSSSSNMSSPTLLSAFDITESDSRSYSFIGFCDACGWYPGQPACPSVYFRFTVFDKDNPENTTNGNVLTL